MSKPDRRKKKAPGGEAGGVPGNLAKGLGGVDPTGKAPTTQPNRKLRRALSREGQNAAALDVMRRRPVNTFELRRMGMASPAARIQDLEAMGYVIDSARIVAVDSDGFAHSGVALYSLVSEPEILVDLEALS